MSEQQLNFELALDELNKLVEKMEQGGLSLEESLTQFERGIFLIRNCQNALKSAEQKVQILTERQNQASLENYEREQEA